MKRLITCIGILSMALACPAISAGEETPAGIATLLAALHSKLPDGPISFDAITELDSGYLGTRSAIFTRQWVWHDAYFVQGQWYEPNYGALSFPIYPPSMTIRSDKQSISIDHSIHGKHFSFAQPSAPRPAFDFPYFNYPIEDLRYFDSYSRNNRVSSRQVEQAFKTGQTSRQLFSTGSLISLGAISLPQAPTNASEIRTTEGLRRTIDYETKEGNLQRMRIFHPETNIQVGGRSVLTVKSGDEITTMSKWQSPFRKNGRIIDIDFSPVPFGGTTATMPVRIEVRDAGTGACQQRIRLSNFRAVDAEVWKSMKTSGLSGELFVNEEERRWRGFQAAAWDLNPASTSEGLKLQARDFKRNYTARLKACEDCVEELRLCSRLVFIELVAGLGSEDDSAAIGAFSNYLAEFSKLGIPNSAIPAGFSFFEFLRRRPQLKCSAKVFQTWMDHCAATIESDEIQAYSMELAKHQEDWLCIAFLERLSEDSSRVTENWNSLANCLATCVESLILKQPESGLNVKPRAVDDYLEHSGQDERIFSRLTANLRSGIANDGNAAERSEYLKKIIARYENRREIASQLQKKPQISPTLFDGGIPTKDKIEMLKRMGQH